MQYYIRPGTKRSNVRHTGCIEQQHLLMGRFPHGPFLGNSLQMNLLYIMLYVITCYVPTLAYFSIKSLLNAYYHSGYEH